MRVVRYVNIEDLKRLSAQWDRLARGVPFRTWAWASTWWRHYGSDAPSRGADPELFVLVVFDDAGRPVGIAPWYCCTSLAHGRIVRFLGSGEVCSDYLSLLCLPGSESLVATAVAEWLADGRRKRQDRWDLIELAGVDASDATVG
ncbi:MAG TPA: hypothetical protein EYP56_12615, partial [Planctomycetaceae bacterium]|nr:hypothetical protein [Planctomycetaceae bacterium]